MNFSVSEENYIKSIYHLQQETGLVNTNSLAAEMQTKAASVTDMLKKLSTKKILQYEKYKGFKLTENGKKVALSVVRKHRLWEYFLVEKLGFEWDKVHDIAEQLEHVVSNELIEQLDEHLGYPKTDPHGDLIPDAKGRFVKNSSKPLSDCRKGDKVKFIGVAEHSNSFLQYLTKSNIKLGDELLVEMIEDFDNSFEVKVNRKDRKLLSKDVVKNLLVVSL